MSDKPESIDQTIPEEAKGSWFMGLMSLIGLCVAIWAAFRLFCDVVGIRTEGEQKAVNSRMRFSLKVGVFFGVALIFVQLLNSSLELFERIRRILH